MSDEPAATPGPTRGTRAAFLLVALVALLGLALAAGDDALGTLALVFPVAGFLALRLAALVAETRFPDAAWRGAARTMLLAAAWAHLVGGLLGARDLGGLPWPGVLASLLLLLGGAMRAQARLKRSGVATLLPVLVVAATASLGLLAAAVLEAAMGPGFYGPASALLALGHLVGTLVAFPRAHAPEPVAGPRPRAPTWVLVGLPLVAYLAFRFTLASRIPYGPIVEWFAISAGAGLLVLLIVRHLGVVSTRGSLPPETHALHTQRIAAMPGPGAQRMHAAVERFVLAGEGKGELVADLRALFDAHRVPPAEYEPSLRALRAHRPRRGEQWGLTAAGRRVLAQNRARRLGLVERCERVVSDRLRLAPRRAASPFPVVDETGNPLVRA